MIYIFLIVGLIVVIALTRKLKKPKIACVALVTGGVKAGKSTFSLALALSKYKSQCRKVKIANFFRILFRKEPFEKPLLYSNVPLACDYVPLTDDLLLRKERFVYSDDSQELNIYDSDIEDSLKTVVISKRVWKKFDAYCYSVLTDHLLIANEIVHGKELADLKARKIVSFRHYKNGGFADVEQNDEK